MVKICAHRGYMGKAPENTLGALRLATELGANLAEIDVQMSADGQAVLMHDERVDRTTDGRGPVVELTLAHLQKLDAGSWFGPQWQGEKVPTLEEVLQETGTLLEELNVELKGCAGQELETEVVRLIRQNDLVDRCLLTSFQHERIDRLGANHPELKLGYIVGRGKWTSGFLTAPVQTLSLEHSLVSADLVAAAHQAGKEIHVWTVNDADQRRQLEGMGVDVVITDYPAGPDSK